MAHTGEEFAFELVGPFHFFVSALQLEIGGGEFAVEAFLHGTKLLLGQLAFGHIANDRAHTQAVLGMYRTQADFDWKLSSVLTLRPESTAAPHRSGNRILPIFIPFWSVILTHAVRNEQFDLLPQQFLPRVSEERLRHGIHQLNAAFAVDFEDRVGRRFQQFAKPPRSDGFGARFFFAVYQLRVLPFSPVRARAVFNHQENAFADQIICPEQIATRLPRSRGADVCQDG
jgi:hypothetical protein